MILNKLNSTLDDGLEQIGVNIDNLTFNLMVDGIYTNKLHSVFREIATNARDSIIEAGKGKLVIDVELTEDTAVVSFKDNGLGLSEEDVKKYLCTLNASSKRDSNTTVGCLGLGSKSPFSLVSYFRYVCIKDGVQTDVELYRVDKESPRFVTSTSETTDENSVECILDIPFSVIGGQDVTRTLIVALVAETCLFEIPIELYINGELSNQHYPEVKVVNHCYLVRYSRSNVNYDVLRYLRTHKKVSCGVVAYACNFVDTYHISESVHIIVKTELGELTFDSSRENIEDTAQNRAYLSAIKTEIPEEFSAFTLPHVTAEMYINVLKKVLEDEGFRDTLPIMYRTCMFYTSRMPLEFFYRFAIDYAENDLSLLVPRITQIYRTLIDKTVEYRGYKADHHYGNCRDGSIVIFTTNEVTQRPSVDEGDAISVLYMPKTGFNHADLQTGFEALTRFLVSKGLKVKHFNKLKTVLDDDELAKYYDRLKPIPKSRGAANRQSSTGLPTACKVKLVYHYKGQRHEEENTIINIHKNFKKNLGAYYQSRAIFIPKSLDVDIEEFAKGTYINICIFEAENDLDPETMELFLKAISKEICHVVKFPESIELTDEEKVKYGRLNVVYQLIENVRTLSNEYGDILEREGKNDYLYRWLDIFRVNDNSSVLRHAYQLIFKVKDTASGGYPFLFCDSLLKLIFTEEELAEQAERAQAITPVWSAQAFYDQIKLAFEGEE